MQSACTFPKWLLVLLDVAVNVAGLVGLVSSLLLLRKSLCGAQRDSVLGRLVTWLAAADIMLGCWTFIPPWIEKPLSSPTVANCPGWYVATLRWLQLWSAALSACISLAILFALQRWPAGVKSLRFAPVVSLVLAVVVSLQYYVTSDVFTDHTLPEIVCDREQSVFFALLGLLFLGVVSVHIYGVVKLREVSPGSVVKRAFSSASRYMLAFFVTWFIPATGSSLLGLFPHLESALLDCSQRWVATIIVYTMVSLNGFFNLVAYQQVAVHCASQAPAVVFGNAEALSFTILSATSSAISTRGSFRWASSSVSGEEEDEGNLEGNFVAMWMPESTTTTSGDVQVEVAAGPPM